MHVCVCVGGGGGITYPFLLSTDRQEKKIMWPCGSCRFMLGQVR